MLAIVAAGESVEAKPPGKLMKSPTTGPSFCVLRSPVILVRNGIDFRNGGTGVERCSVVCDARETWFVSSEAEEPQVSVSDGKGG
jgi:hypothetical protein